MQPHFFCPAPEIKNRVEAYTLKFPAPALSAPPHFNPDGRPCICKYMAGCSDPFLMTSFLNSLKKRLTTRQVVVKIGGN